MDMVWKVFVALAPTVGVLFIFWHVMKSILEGDRRERIAHAQWEREQDRAAEGVGPERGQG
ncbi:lysyl-tRNA synthetase [Arsenicicoccus dermatophilus]|uniref:lysyl-tRNA synthetase n=1 Tax=Arsenicicoccus dermatophilus TaxID=1076331 RepID=UPI001F4CC6F7|nr:lysyl-tRNA synthetase [Arsenicicoccus dermatophilus]MCH8613904.1 lysyl-tRNA synthetase [Arsenicicoccus dermatophilus]